MVTPQDFIHRLKSLNPHSLSAIVYSGSERVKQHVLVIDAILYGIYIRHKMQQVFDISSSEVMLLKAAEMIHLACS